MSSKTEKIIEIKSCQQCQLDFSITDKDMAFYHQVSPVFDWEKYGVPAPMLCPDCRMQKRMAFRNERMLYKRNCDSSGRSMISMFSPESKHSIYHQDIWESDKMDGLAYGREFDFERSFFEQFEDLQGDVPITSLYSFYWQNSDYCNCASYQKNGYLVFASANDEDCMYCSYVNDSKNCIDCLMVHDSESCFQVVDSKNCFDVSYSRDCADCSSCQYSSDLINCNNCYRCSNLVGKSYCIENKQYSKQEYNEMLASGDLEKSIKTGYKKYMSWTGNENVLWDYINDSKNASFSFDCYDLEDCKYNIWFSRSKSCYDNYSWWIDAQNMYESVGVGNNCSNVLYCSSVFGPSSDIIYSMFGLSLRHCFGCIWLTNAQYCILNKQYTKQEYEALIPKIIEHMKSSWEWGQFFPNELSPFPYTDTVANDFYPLDKSAATGQWFNWSDYQSPAPQVEKTILASQLPENITDIPDDILNWAIVCEVTGKPFQIMKAELEFYRKRGISIPKIHPDQRNLDRIRSRNPRKFVTRNCDNCEIEIQTTYSPERPEKIYCENCYNKKLY